MPTFVVGDVHGHRELLVELLRGCGLVDGRDGWSGADARLWLIGDLVDRGPDGIGAIDVVMRLQGQGDVRCLLGNHEAALVGAARFGDAPCGEPELTFRDLWELNGGRDGDLARLRPEHVAWIERLPALARDGRLLLVHSDTDRYLEYGASVEVARAAISAVVAGERTDRFAVLLGALADRGAFGEPARLQRLLDSYGADRVVHGHTPIWYAQGVAPEDVTAPLVYAGGAAMNVDHCLFAGGPGFVTELR